MIKRENIEFTVKDSTGQLVSFTMHPDSTIDEYVNAFKTLLTFLTFDSQCIKDIFYDECESSE